MEIQPAKLEEFLFAIKNNIKRYESELVIQEVRESVPSEVESEKASVPEKKREYAKAQIETIY